MLETIVLENNPGIPRFLESGSSVLLQIPYTKEALRRIRRLDYKRRHG